jgi:hypothetical protein
MISLGSKHGSASYPDPTNLTNRRSVQQPLAVSLVVAHRSNLSRRVQAFMKWIEDVLTPYLELRDEHLRPATKSTF